jgi:hypothetical protein
MSQHGREVFTVNGKNRMVMIMAVMGGAGLKATHLL